MNDKLQEAELCMKRAHEAYAEHPTVSVLELQFAVAYAAVAQAQAMERIADALEPYTNMAGETFSLAESLHLVYRSLARE